MLVIAFLSDSHTNWTTPAQLLQKMGNGKKGPELKYRIKANTAVSSCIVQIIGSRPVCRSPMLDRVQIPTKETFKTLTLILKEKY